MTVTGWVYLWTSDFYLWLVFIVGMVTHSHLIVGTKITTKVLLIVSELNNTDTFITSVNSYHMVLMKRKDTDKNCFKNIGERCQFV